MKTTFFINNRRKILGKAGCDIVILAANNRMQRNGDNTFAFRQDSNFWYFCGVNEPDYVLVFSSTSSFLIAPKRSDIEIFFDGQLSNSQLKKVSGVDDVYDNDVGWELLTQMLNAANYVGHISPVVRKNVDFVPNDARFRLRKKIKQHMAPKARLRTINAVIAQSRMIKQPEELTQLKKAIRITTEAFHEFLKQKSLKNYKFEYEIEADFNKFFARKNSVHAYTPIVGSGKRSCTLHYNKNDHVIKNGELILVDIGAEVNNYAADITRTVVMGKATIRQLQVIGAVKKIQSFALSQIKPGMTLLQSEQNVAEFTGSVLIELGLIESATKEAIRKYSPHATSHFLGLDVHDVGDYRAPLKPNMVITVEPGIYIPEEKIGVRIEDDVLITKNGCKVLSSSLPAVLE